MKVVDGNFGQEKESPTLGESVNEVIEIMELGNLTDPKYVLVIEHEDRMFFATNHKDNAYVVAAMEHAKLATLTGAVS